ncbi:MAG: ABC transporter permease [Clostridia bacterium]|jgi:simple sugar transport system permease protein/ribose transport system permease protein|nr:ABC transporter permease [Clostridia bacterium]
MSKKLKLQLFLLENMIWVLIAVFFLFNAFVTTNFATPRNIINILYHSSIMSMLVLGQGIIMVIGNLDLSLESTLAFAPGLTMLLAVNWFPGTLGPITCIILTLLIGVLVGIFNGVLISKVQVNPFLQTLSVLIMLRGLVLFLVPFSIFPLPEAYSFVGQAWLFDKIPAAIVVVFLIYFIFHIVFQYTTFGRKFMATGGNARASFVSGIDTTKMVIIAFALSGLLAAVAGLLTAGRQGSVNNSMGEGMVMLAFAGAILGGASLEGGKGTPVGMLGGAILLGMISNSLTLLGVQATLVYATQGALIFLAIIIDRLRIYVRNRLLHQEQLRKLKLENP